MTNLLPITPTSLLASFARHALRAWQGLRSVWRFGKPLSVAAAQKRRVCRICKIDSMPGPSNAFIFNHGEEYAHEKCLGGRKSSRQTDAALTETGWQRHAQQRSGAIPLCVLLCSFAANLFAVELPPLLEPLDLTVTNIVVIRRHHYFRLTSHGIDNLGRLTEQQYQTASLSTPETIAILRSRHGTDMECVWRPPPVEFVTNSTINVPVVVSNFSSSILHPPSSASALPPPPVPDEPPLMPPQPWQEELFRYQCVPGQEPRPDATGQLSGFACLFSFLAESNKCYRICASTDGQQSWRPLTSICPASATGPNIVPMPVGNFPESCQLAPDPLTQTGLGYWSVSTNLMVTANNVAYKLESHY